MTRWRKPLYGTGAVPPPESQQRCVAFVCAEFGGERKPIGTAFVVGVPGEHPGEWVRYFVTAAHVVRDGKPKWIRLRRWDGAPADDVPMGEWVRHPTSDIAATLCEVPGNEYILNYQEEKYFADVHPPDRRPQAGDAAYFMGLLGHIEALGTRGVPMLRAACIGALYVDDVPITDGPEGYTYTRKEPVAHLIDCYSRAGFSGGPVYVDYRTSQVIITEQGSVVRAGVESYSALLGVMIGHFGGGENNAGVAIVVPIDALRELLEHDRLVEWRKAEAARFKQRREAVEAENAAVLDSVTATDDAPLGRDERVSAWPASFEEVVRAMHATPAPPRNRPAREQGDGTGD
jgi:hypothetical protein